MTIGGYVPQVGGMVVGAVRPQKLGALEAYACVLGTAAELVAGMDDGGRVWKRLVEYNVPVEYIQE